MEIESTEKEGNGRNMEVGGKKPFLLGRRARWQRWQLLPER
jgi:hypothetical protein